MSKRPEAYSGERCERKKIDEELALSAKKNRDTPIIL